MEETIQSVSKDTKCHDCGAVLKFAPGTRHLKCEYCGADNEIASEADQASVVKEEIDFEKFLSENNVAASDKQEVSAVKCDSCGATTTLKPNITSDSCPFCSNTLVIKNASTCSIIKPKYVLPFAIDSKKGMEAFKKWVDGLWFAPGDLKRYAQTAEKLAGMYLPYWTYDSDTHSSYTGMRGMNYTTTESYTAIENGKSVSRTRTVTKIRWTPCAGNVNNTFDDVLVIASRSLPEKYVNALEPWDLGNLSAYDDRYLSGFRAETYQVDVKGGFDKAKVRMTDEIRNTCRRDIGGDHQQVLTVNTSYNNITFKHILLPIWISAFKYNAKVYRFMINGRTGEVQGERPWSIWKIVGLAVGVIAAAAIAWWLFGNS